MGLLGMAGRVGRGECRREDGGGVGCRSVGKYSEPGKCIEVDEGAVEVGEVE